MKPATAVCPAAAVFGRAGLGVVLGPTSDRLTAELVEAAMAGAADLGLEARGIRRGDDQSQLGVLLGIGYPTSLLPVLAEPSSCPRVVWVGEALMPRDALRAGHFAPLPDRAERGSHAGRVRRHEASAGPRRFDS